MSIRDLLKRPSAFLPFVLSAAALALIVGYVALFGTDVDPSGDEGAAARIFQLLLAAQAVVMVVFAVTWLPRAPRPVLLVLALQVGAAVIPIATVMALVA